MDNKQGGIPPPKESLPVWKLDDRELLAVIRGRGGEIATANALAGLAKVFELAREKGRKGMWIEEILGLIALYSQNYSPGHEDHPFRDFDVKTLKMQREGPPLEREKPNLEEQSWENLSTLRKKKGAETLTKPPKVEKSEETPAPSPTFYSGSKLRTALAEILNLVGSKPFEIRDLMKQSSLSSFARTDIVNAMSRGITEGKLSKVRYGVYVAVKELA